MSWTYLPTPQNSIAVWSLVEQAWGHKSFEDVVGLHRIATTFAYIAPDREIVALFNLTPIHSLTSAWLSIWLRKTWRRKRYSMKPLWEQAQRIIFKDLGFITITAITQDATVAKLATRFGGRHCDTAHNLYGINKHGYIVIWD